MATYSKKKTEKVLYSEKLKMLYTLTVCEEGKNVVFQDGVSYNNEELKKIKNVGEIGLINTHEIKAVFNGIIV